MHLTNMSGKEVITMSEKVNVAEIFGSNVFNDAAMRERLPKAVYKELKKTIDLVRD